MKLVIKIITEIMANKNDTLEPVEKEIVLKTNEAIDPKEYFQKRKGLYVWFDFAERILSKAKPVKAKTSFTISSFKLLEYAADKKIESALPKKHLFTESEVCAVIAELITKQPKGQEGNLLNNGYANLFYTKSFVVLVVWDDGDWRVDAWRRDGREWGDGGRVFSPAN